MANFNTSRDFFTAIINGTAITTEMVEYATAAIAKMDAKNANKRSTLSATQIANSDLKSKILDFMIENGSQSAKSLADNFSTSTQKISALMKQLVDTGNVTVTKAKFEGSSTKVNVYSIVE